MVCCACYWSKSKLYPRFWHPSMSLMDLKHNFILAHIFAVNVHIYLDLYVTKWNAFSTSARFGFSICSWSPEVLEFEQTTSVTLPVRDSTSRGKPVCPKIAGPCHAFCSHTSLCKVREEWQTSNTSPALPLTGAFVFYQSDTPVFCQYFLFTPLLLQRTEWQITP